MDGPVPLSRRWHETARMAGRRLFERLSRSAQHRAMMAVLDEIVARQEQEKAWRKIFRRQLSAVIRQQFLAGTDIPTPYWLRAQRARLRSQNEEDGITLALLRAAGVVNRRFVEIGSGKTGGNSAVLAFDCGWAGLMVEMGTSKVESLRRALAFNPSVKVVKARVTPENFNRMLTDHGFAGEVDFMSIDVDGIDYWLLDALKVCSPRLLVMEYNIFFGPDRALTLPPTDIPPPRPRGYFGASFRALEKKAPEKGYRLVMCEAAGVNAFFVRDGAAPQIEGLSPADALSMVDEFDPTDQTGMPLDIFALIGKLRLPIVEVQGGFHSVQRFVVVWQPRVDP